MKLRHETRLVANPWRSVWKAATILLLCRCASLTLAEPHMLQFTVEGVVTNNIPRTGPGAVVPFRASSDGTNWLVRFSVNNGPIDFVEAFSLGDKVAYLCNMESWLAEKRRKGETVGSNACIAMIRRGAVPFFPMQQEAGVVWQTFFSGEFYRTNVDGFITPLFVYGFMGAGHVKFEDLTLQAFTRGAVATDLRIPREVSLLFKTRNGPVRSAAYDRMFEGQTNAMFRLLATTNLGTAVLPAQSELEVSIPPPFADPVPIPEQEGWTQKHIRFGVRTTNVILETPSDVLTPKILGVAPITDLRFAATNGILLLTYRSDKWLPDEELRQRPEYKSAHERIFGRRPGVHTKWFLVCVVALMTAPIATMWLSRRKRQPQ